MNYQNSAVFYRDLKRDLPLIVRGQGCWLTDESGKHYLDAAGGAFAACLGHGVETIGKAMARQAAEIAYVNGTAFTNKGAEDLAARLVHLAPAFSHAYILGSGSEAIEAALKLARQFWAEEGRATKQKIIALSPSYHGNTMLALSSSAREHYRRMWQGWLVDIVRMKAPYAYRCSCAGAADCPACSGSLLEETILAEGPETVAAFVVEPVGGSSTGANVPRPSYFGRVREICDRHDVLLVADEVLCGAGRTGTWTALEQWNVAADIMTLGKGISGGYAPVSAVMAAPGIVERIAAGTGHLMHAQTYSHHPVTSAAAVAAIDHCLANGLVQRCRAMGPVMHQKLAALLRHSVIGDIRGRGLLAGIEFVRDRETKQPFPRALRVAERFTARAREHGLTVWPNTGHADGNNGDLVCLAPPYIVTDGEIDEIVTRFSETVTATMADVGD
ncbi:MAG: aminotransferase family protein [Gemmatimonadota bacterium]